MAQLTRRNYAVTTATIANAGTTSNAVDVRGFPFGTISTPGTMTGTVFTFLGSSDNGVTFNPVCDTNGNAVSKTWSTSKGYPFPPELAGYTHFKIVGGSAESGARSFNISVSG